MQVKKMEKRKLKVPHTYVILVSVILLAALLTYIIPAGQFDMVKDEATGRNIVDSSSFHLVDKNPTKFFDLFKSVPKGLKAASGIVFFVFVVGGAFQIVTATGAIEAGIGKVAFSLKGREKIMIPILIIIFSIGGGTIGMAEEVMIFVPIGIALARALGYDALTGTAMVALGAACGFTSGFMNPFTVGIAQGIAELPLFSGILFRLIILVVMLVITIWYIVRYAEKVKKDPSKSIVRELELNQKDNNIDLLNIPEMNTGHSLVLLTFLCGLGVIVWGVFKSGWYITEIGSAFLAIGIFCGFVGKLGPSKIAEEFLAGAKSMVFGALAIGIARSILVIMQDGHIIDTTINGLASAIETLPKSIAILGMYVVQVVVNFFIPSGSGQAAATMPIMTPLADILKINRQVAVMAFQFGDGFTNSIIPTSGALLAYLSVANIPYDKWFKFIWPLMLIWIGIGATFLLVANMINYGPF